MTEQRVSFPVEGRDVLGTLHVEGRPIGAALVLHGYGGDPEQPHVVATATALAASGLAALRFAYRDHRPPEMTLASALADAEAALRLLRAHPAVRATAFGLVGFSFGGAVGAVLAGREASVRATVLCAPPSFPHQGIDPVAALTRTRSRVLFLWGTADTEVKMDTADRYLDALAAARIDHRLETIAGATHDFDPPPLRARMATRAAEFVRDAF